MPLSSYGRVAAAAVAAAASVLRTAESSTGKEYDKLCDEIQQHAVAAGDLYNSGRQAEAFASLDEARKSYRAAKKLAPDKAQAHINMGTAMLNSQHFDEAIEAWRAAKKRVKDPTYSAWVEGRLRWTRFGKVSVRRDRTYNGGQGNMTKARLLMKKQLAIYPESPWLMHDLATVCVMLSAPELPGGEEAVQCAETSFTEAHKAALGAWRAGLISRRRGGSQCRESGPPEGAVGAAAGGGGIVYDWVSWFERYGGAADTGSSEGESDSSPLVDLRWVADSTRCGATYGADDTFHDQGGYVAQFQDVGLSGDDGLIVDEARCLFFAASAGSFVSMTENLQMLETWMPSRTPQSKSADWYDLRRGYLPEHGRIVAPRAIPRAASVVQFAGSSHFHVLTEVAARLALLARGGVLEEEGLQLIAPQDAREGRGFITAILRTMASKLLEENRVLWWAQGVQGRPDLRVRVGTLYYADWRPPAPMTADGALCSTPRCSLLMARNAFLAGLRAKGATNPRTVIFLTRRGTKDMRSQLDGEDKFRQKVAKAAGAAPKKLALKEFDGSLSPADTVALFSKARAVVGVHGGALANILFCPPMADVFELGFASPFAGHYRHLAAALGLRIQLLPLVADERGMGSNRVRLLDPAAAVATIATALAQDGRVGEDEL